MKKELRMNTLDQRLKFSFDQIFREEGSYIRPRNFNIKGIQLKTWIILKYRNWVEMQNTNRNHDGNNFVNIQTNLQFFTLKTHGCRIFLVSLFFFSRPGIGNLLAQKSSLGSSSNPSLCQLYSLPSQNKGWVFMNMQLTKIAANLIKSVFLGRAAGAVENS